MRIYFSDFTSNFSRFSFGMRTFAMLPNILRCERIDFLPTKILYGVSSCTPLVVHRFMRGRLCDICVCMCVREREREREEVTLMNTIINGG
mgnify:CR=1 FL=1